MTGDARAVANFLLDYADQIGRPVSNLALQKIVYFCHGWYLAVFDRPLIEEPVQAWEHGPVFKSLYRSFKSAGNAPINFRATTMNYVEGKEEVIRSEFDPETAKFLLNVFDAYSRYRPGQLRQITHLPDGPWKQVWEDARKRPQPGMKISNDSIKAYFLMHPQGLDAQ